MFPLLLTVLNRDYSTPPIIIPMFRTLHSVWVSFSLLPKAPAVVESRRVKLSSCLAGFRNGGFNGVSAWNVPSFQLVRVSNRGYSRPPKPQPEPPNVLNLNIHTSVYIYMYVSKHMNVYTYLCVYIYICVYMYIYIYTYIHMYICIYLYLYKYIYIYVYIQILLCIYSIIQNRTRHRGRTSGWQALLGSLSAAVPWRGPGARWVWRRNEQKGLGFMQRL